MAKLESIKVDVSCNCENFKEKEPKYSMCLNDSSFKCNYKYVPQWECCSSTPGTCGCSEKIVKDKASEAIKSIREIANEQLSELYEGFITAKTGIIEQELKAKDEKIKGLKITNKVSELVVKDKDKEIELITSDSKGILAIMESQRKSMRDKDEKIETKNKKIWDLGCEMVEKDKEIKLLMGSIESTKRYDGGLETHIEHQNVEIIRLTRDKNTLFDRNTSQSKEIEALKEQLSQQPAKIKRAARIKIKEKSNQVNRIKHLVDCVASDNCNINTD